MGVGRKNGSGRKKGTPNKASITVLQKAQELLVDPFLILLQIASGNWKALGYEAATEVKVSRSGMAYEVDIITLDQRLKAASEACQYLYPKRKALQITDETDPTKDRPYENMSDEELDEELRNL